MLKAFCPNWGAFWAHVEQKTESKKHLKNYRFSQVFQGFLDIVGRFGGYVGRCWSQVRLLWLILARCWAMLVPKFRSRSTKWNKIGAKRSQESFFEGPLQQNARFWRRTGVQCRSAGGRGGGSKTWFYRSLYSFSTLVTRKGSGGYLKADASAAGPYIQVLRPLFWYCAWWVAKNQNL